MVVKFEYTKIQVSNHVILFKVVPVGSWHCTSIKNVIVVVGDNVVEISKTLGSDETPIASITLDGEPLASALKATGSLLIGGDQFSGILSVESSALKVDLRPTRYRVSAVDLDDKGN